jgi:hypothetical protein
MIILLMTESKILPWLPEFCHGRVRDRLLDELPAVDVLA